jgi:hypothetical protein
MLLTKFSDVTGIRSVRACIMFCDDSSHVPVFLLTMLLAVGSVIDCQYLRNTLPNKT